RAPDLDAVVAGIADRIARDDQPARLDREDPGRARGTDRVAGDLAFDCFEHDAVAAGIDDLAVAARDVAAGRQLNETGVLGQLPAGAVERDAGEENVVGPARD